jgi:NADPH:quinone reductase-like Zn-dependent oxidoreductase
VLVHGASGAVGAAAVQIARHLGAHVDGVCSGPNAELVRGLGASRAIDYTRDNPAADRDSYDVVLDAVGNHSFADWRPALRRGGRCALIVATARDFLVALRTRRADRRAIAGVTPDREDNLRELMRLAEAGVLRPVVDSVFEFADITKAHSRVDSGRKRGSVVIRFAAND